MIKDVMRRFMPKALLEIRRHFLNRYIDSRFTAMPVQEVFSTIYNQNLWGDGEAGHYSGPGSHSPDIIGPYIEAIQEFAGPSKGQLSALDVGCGDFNVGSQIAPLFASYIGCDVVKSVVETNRERYESEFLVIDATKDKTPSADVIFIREVLQHLSNADISKVIRNLGEWKYLIVTESHYSGIHFEPNLDITTGPFARRSGKQSGVVLHEHPFNLDYGRCEIICEVPSNSASKNLVTYLYTRA